MTGKAIPCFSNKVFHIFLFERKASKSSTQNRHLCRWDWIDNRQGNGKKKSPLKGHTRKSTLKDEPENVEKTAHSEKRGQKGKYQNLKRRILRTVSLRSLQIMEQSIDEQVFFCVRSSKTESLIIPNLTVSDVCLALLKRTNWSSYNNIHDEWLMPLNLKNVSKIRWSCDVPGWFFHIDSKQREILVTGNINHLKTHSSESTSAKTWDYKKRTCILTKSLP